MNILLSRILTYLNGTLFHDYNYKICTFIIFHYLEMEDMSEEDFLKKGCFKKEELYAFIALLGFHEYVQKDRWNGVAFNTGIRSRIDSSHHRFGDSYCECDLLLLGINRTVVI